MRDKEWADTIKALTGERKEAMAYLYTHIPLSDIDCYPIEYFISVLDHALMLRARFLWCNTLERELFEQYVLCPRVNDEELSAYHGLFFNELYPRIEGLTAEEAVLEANRWCHERATYEAQDNRTVSALTVYRSGSGRCGEESVFLVAALRSIGIAARQVYAQRWSHCDDNHAWVEAYCGGKWRFLGACEPELTLDYGWFNAAASRAMLIRSRVFGNADSPLHGEFISKDGSVSWFNQTARYAATRLYSLAVRVKGECAQGALLYVQILNEAAFHTVAVLKADENGKASITLGLGSFRVLAVKGALYAHRVCGEHEKDEGEIVLELSETEANEGGWQEFDFIAPDARTIEPAESTMEQRRLRMAMLSCGDAIRRERHSKMRCANDGEFSALLDEARANAAEIRAFLAGDDKAERLSYIKALPKKYLRDTPRATLEEHFTYSVRRSGIPKHIFERYVRSPLIANEKLTPWRRALGAWLSSHLGTNAAAEASAESVRTLLAETVTAADESRVYSMMYTTPLEALEARRCDARSFELLFVASLRSLGIPARLRIIDGETEFWHNGGFHAVNEPCSASIEITGFRSGAVSLSRWKGGEWRRMALSMNNVNELPAGQYEMVTSVRSPNGNQYAARLGLYMASGDEMRVAPHYRDCPIDGMLSHVALPAISAVTPEGKVVADAMRGVGGVYLLLWLDTGAEPTEHLINELAAEAGRLKNAGIAVRVFLRNRESASRHTFCALAKELGSLMSILLDDYDYDLETVARLMGCDRLASPLALVCSNNASVFACSDYRVGIAELLVTIAMRAIEINEGQTDKRAY